MALASPGQGRGREYVRGSLPGRDILLTSRIFAQTSSCTGNPRLRGSDTLIKEYLKSIPSHEHPGYLLSNQVPPTWLPFSRMTKFRHDVLLSRSIAIHSPSCHQLAIQLLLQPEKPHTRNTGADDHDGGLRKVPIADIARDAGPSHFKTLRSRPMRNKADRAIRHRGSGHIRTRPALSGATTTSASRLGSFRRRSRTMHESCRWHSYY